MNPAHNRQMPRLALMLCVRDEERFLKENLLYHHALGVERAYVFLHKCTDRSREIAAGFPGVTAIDIANDKFDENCHVASVQLECMKEAIKAARRDGLEWLLCLDADEFAFGDATTPTADRTLADKPATRAGSL